ncbi:hypothetical protein [Streptomyces reticuli]|uniref:hypothetical protein n=1 Tax=Streptomyces reticuli TaxID=1926 RepID=UPI00073DF7EA|nr:hypothetical protein [Streptomyces sp. SID7810]CUW31754.1 hypothetical protein TUE45_06503 [Streptomyces reticuli]
MPASAQTVQSTEWPEGVIARYLTIAGVTVDIKAIGIDRQTSVGTVTDITITAYCQGCRQKDVSTYLGMDASTFGDDFFASSLGDAARDWAQAHAEKCRALPRPTA